MKLTITKKWVKALRSGKYKQHRGDLVGPKGNSFCCLGVLTDLYCKEFPTSKVKKTLEPKSGDDILCYNVRKWAGLKTYNGSYGPLPTDIWKDRRNRPDD